MKQLMFPKKAKKKLPSIKLLIARADSVFSKWIRERDKLQGCATPSEKCQGYFQCSHLIRRGKAPTRYSEINCTTQCASHNYMHNNYPEIYTKWFIKKYGVEKYNELVKASQVIHKWSRAELGEIIERYKL